MRYRVILRTFRLIACNCSLCSRKGARCLDEAPLDWFETEPFDGRNWDTAIHTLG